MKSAIYIEDGVTQLVLTPESDFERWAMSTAADKELVTEIFHGTFYDCRGGWVRQTSYYHDRHGSSGDYKDSSIIIRISKKHGAQEEG